MLASVQKDASRMATGRLNRQDTGKEHPEVRSRRGGDTVCMSSAQKRAYLESATEDEMSQNEALKKEFERLRKCIHPPSGANRCSRPKA